MQVNVRCCSRLYLTYRKIPIISPGAYIFQRPFLRGSALEGLIFGGAYVRREICVTKSIGLACGGEELPFLHCFTLYSKANSQYNPHGGLYSEGRFKGRFCALRFWGAYIRRCQEPIFGSWRGLFSEFYGMEMYESL